MSTRTCIFVLDAPTRSFRPASAIRLYRHTDGYPDSVLPDLAQAVGEVERRRSIFIAEHKPTAGADVGADVIAALIAVYSSSIMGLTVEQEATKPLRGRKWTRAMLASLLGNQCDLEYVYVVDLGIRAVNVYSTKFGVAASEYSGTPLEHLMAGIAPPDLAAVTVAQYQGDFRAASAEAITSAIADLKMCGWTVVEQADFLLQEAARIARRNIEVLMRRLSPYSVSLPGDAETEDDSLAVSVF